MMTAEADPRNKDATLGELCLAVVASAWLVNVVQVLLEATRVKAMSLMACGVALAVLAVPTLVHIALRRNAYWRALGSLQFATAVLMTLVVATMSGTLIVQTANLGAFSVRYGAAAPLLTWMHLHDVYASFWFRWLLSLFTIGLAASVLRRRAWRLKQIGFLFSHGGAVLLLAGGIASATYGSRGVVNLQVGDTTSDYALESGIKTKLPFSLNLQRFDVDKRPGRSAGTETIVDFASTIAAVDSAGRKNTAQIRVNAPSTWQGYSLYQASYDPKNTRLSGILVVHDPGLPLALLGLVATLLGILHILWWIPRRVATRGT